jgi:predicted amidophosphoribosyltransferase
MVDSKPLIPTGRELPSSTLRLLGDGLLNLFYPAGCLCCSLPVSRLQDRGVCASCWKAVLGLRTTGGHCPVCGLPYLSYGGESSHLCGRCTLHPPPYSGARSFGWYRAPLSQIIRALKFDGRSDLSGLLAPLMASAFVECWSPGEIDWIVPVPLHGKRIRERGFNQAALLAKKLSRLVGIPCPPGFLERVRATMPQVGLSDAERFRMSVAVKKGARLAGRMGPRVGLLPELDGFNRTLTVSPAARNPQEDGAPPLRLRFAR